MSKSTTEITSGAVREIEPELRELFTKVVERDPREAAKMLEPYRMSLWFRCSNCLIPRQR
jgi:hypothetical protein